jgi:hypothetical protein
LLLNLQEALASPSLFLGAFGESQLRMGSLGPWLSVLILHCLELPLKFPDGLSVLSALSQFASAYTMCTLEGPINVATNNERAVADKTPIILFCLNTRESKDQYLRILNSFYI